LVRSHLILIKCGSSSIYKKKLSSKYQKKLGIGIGGGAWLIDEQIKDNYYAKIKPCLGLRFAVN
jgi:hypothetical protein